MAGNLGIPGLKLRLSRSNILISDFYSTLCLYSASAQLSGDTHTPACEHFTIINLVGYSGVMTVLGFWLRIRKMKVVTVHLLGCLKIKRRHAQSIHHKT